MAQKPYPNSREDKLQNARTCKLCKTPIDCGIEGMMAHIDDEHSLEELATEVSFSWTPNEPKVFEHPSGTVHFITGGTREAVETTCGNRFTRQSTTDGEPTEDWDSRKGYKHYDEDRYCGSCLQTHNHTHAGTYLPEPLANSTTR